VVEKRESGAHIGRPFHPKNDKTWVGQVGGNVRDMRVKRGWSLHDLSAKSGIEYTFLSEFERGLRDASVNDFVCICDAFAVKPKHLLPDDVSVPEESLGKMSLTFMAGICGLLRRSPSKVLEQVGEKLMSSSKVRMRIRKKAV